MSEQEEEQEEKEWEVTITFTGTAKVIVTAETEDEAKIDAEISDDSDWEDIQFDESSADAIEVKPHEW